MLKLLRAEERVLWLCKQWMWDGLSESQERSRLFQLHHIVARTWHQKLWDSRGLATWPQGKEQWRSSFSASYWPSGCSSVPPSFGEGANPLGSLKYSQHFIIFHFEHLLPFLSEWIVNSLKAESDFIFISSVPNRVPIHDEYAINLRWSSDQIYVRLVID